ncbi:helix-turn-helix transcriptional regulator [Chitinophaga niabensis]|uniref:Predicted transcriptional regulator, ArsR family n=1 Tax=Chitinophaga niabensis TaxID=536979 RepID=A0A1N6DLQ0_9BACT|nr:metalloregulator ArsR/SmtB family transcription factor [Chitinophaga niabensis]SIN71603.1 Predicted transcriptional regulator, ArsR family [Chitinophaga niabensis]
MNNNPAENEKAIWLLKTRGPQPLTAIAIELGITVEGARFQLLKLANEGLVQATTESKGRGRPQQIWGLTSAGHARFPDTHAELTVKILNTMRDTLGQAAIQTVIDANEKIGILKYKADLKGLTDLESKVRQLAEVRNREGYMAEYKKEDDGYLLIENHCPICAAATVCQGFCQSELNTFKTVLGKNAHIKRVDHILAGARRCAYRITGS